MTTIKNKVSEREEIEALLPWHAAGTLTRREAQKVEQALAADADLAAQYATIREDLAETIVANETLGAPSARAMQKLMADIEADASTARRARTSFNLGSWLSETLSSFSPRTLAWSATAAALAVVLQAGLLAGMFVSERQGTGPTLASYQDVTKSIPEGVTDLIMTFSPQANIADVNKLLNTYKMAVIDGPNGGNIYTVRLAMTGMPKEELARLVKQLQDEKTLTLVSPKPTTKTN
jgi:anti-sigma-K factor RskA